MFHNRSFRCYKQSATIQSQDGKITNFLKSKKKCQVSNYNFCYFSTVVWNPRASFHHILLCGNDSCNISFFSSRWSKFTSNSSFFEFLEFLDLFRTYGLVKYLQYQRRMHSHYPFHCKVPPNVLLSPWVITQHAFALDLPASFVVYLSYKGLWYLFFLSFTFSFFWSGLFHTHETVLNRNMDYFGAVISMGNQDLIGIIR